MTAGTCSRTSDAPGGVRQVPGEYATDLSGAQPGVERPGPRVLIVYKDLPHYRVAFFEMLKESLQALGVELDLVFGQPAGVSATKNDTRELDWARHIRSLTWGRGGRTIYWQPVLKDALKSDLVIVEQANKLLVNYPLLALNALGRIRLGFWGHGRDFQTQRPHSPAERIKRWYSRMPYWWFAYNETSAAVVKSLGFPATRITLVQNAIDTTSFGAQVLRARESAPNKEQGDRCLFVGGMYAEKRLEFLIEAAMRVKRAVPGFRLTLIGAGPDQRVAERAAQEHEWIEYLGPRFGEDLASQYASANLLLMPGLVGLGVLDSFAAGVPMVTTAVPYHSPEIEYLVDGVNGVVVADTQSVESYAHEVIELLQNRDQRERLSQGCIASAGEYTVEEMVRRFSDGVLKALAEEHRR